VLAVGLALFLPQFYLPPAARIAHGVLIGIGLAILAVSLWRTKATPVADTGERAIGLDVGMGGSY
jgi:hypothetical protein